MVHRHKCVMCICVWVIKVNDCQTCDGETRSFRHTIASILYIELDSFQVHINMSMCACVVNGKHLSTCTE